MHGHISAAFVAGKAAGRSIGHIFGVFVAGKAV